MTMRPLVSIVTPTYNRAAYLRETMASVRRQTYPRVEHVVVDGASTDDTVEMLEKAEGSYVLRWVSEPDDGMYHAINKGLQLAQGEILAYLNSDDLYLPWTVEAVVEAFERYPEADFIYGDALAVDEATGTTEPYWMMPFHLDFVRRFGYLTQPAVFWRRRAYESVGPFDTSLRYLADCEYWMRAGGAHRFQKIHEFLAVERNHTGTLRQSLASEVEAEISQLRGRYVRLSGDRHERMLRWHHIRGRYHFRLYTLGLLLQSLVPTRVRRGPWRRMLAAGLRFSRSRAFVSLLPRTGRRVAGDKIFSPATRWLHQATDERE